MGKAGDISEGDKGTKFPSRNSWRMQTMSRSLVTNHIYTRLEGNEKSWS